MATRTAVSTTAGNWSNAASWDTGVPVDTDAFIIPDGKSITFDVDQTAMGTGMAASQINGTGQLLITQTPGTYVLKLAGTLSGTGVLSLYGATSTTDLADNVIFNITSTYNGSLVTLSGALNIRCTEPAVPVATLKAAYGIGTTKIYVNETLDTVWANGRTLRVDNLVTLSSEEFTIVNTGVDGGGQYITLSGTGLAVAKVINSKVILTQRNIQFTGNSGSAQYCFNGVHGSYVKAGFRNFNRGWNSCYSNTVSGGTWSGNSSGWIYCYSNTARSAIFANTNTYHLQRCPGGLFDSCTFTGATRYYQCGSLYMAANAYTQATNDGGVANAFSARSIGGTTTSSAVSPPTGHTFSYLHTCEDAAAPCFRQTAYTLEPYESISLVVYMKKSSAGWGILPKIEILDAFQDPLTNATFTPLATATMTDSSGVWETLNITYANTTGAPRQILVRITAQNASNLLYEYYDRFSTSSGVLANTISVTGKDIHAEVLLGTFTSIKTDNYSFQIRLSNIPANDQTITLRLEHTDNAGVVLGPAIKSCSYAKWAAANTTFGVPMFGPIWLVAGEKINFYATSNDVTATNVSARIDTLYAQRVLGGSIQ